MKHIQQDEVLAQGRNYYLGFGFCSCSWKQKNHQFRLIQACDATPCNVIKAQKTNLKLLDLAWTHPPQFWIISKSKQLVWGYGFP